MASEKIWDVIVIGAGLSGLKAAFELKTAGKSVLVLEARDRVGGRSMPGEIAGQTVDFGGQWVGPQQKVLLEQARELGVETYPQYTAGASLLSRSGSVSSYTSSIPRLPVLSLLELALIERRWQRDMKTLPASPWLAERGRAWDSETLESWMSANVRTSGARDFVKAVVGALLCADTSQVSYLFFLDTLRRGQGLRSMIDVAGGAQQDKFVGGAWQVPKRLADRLTGDIQLNSPVLAVEQAADSVRVATAKAIHAAGRVIIAVPPVMAARIDFSPALPVKRTGLMVRMPMGNVIKVHVAYETPFWRRRQLNGSVVSTDRSLGVVFDQTLQDERVGVLVGLIDGPHALAMSQLGSEERRKHVVADLVHFFGDDAARPIDYVEHDWIADPWARGGCAAHMTPGTLTAYGDALRQPCGRIHWAGTETATEWAGYLDGALQAGKRAAAEALAA